MYTADVIDGWNWSITMYFGVSPKLTLECGNCEFTWQTRPPLIDYPKVICPACNKVNKVPIVIGDGRGPGL